MAKKETIKLTTPVFRVAFPSVFEKSSYQGSAEKYSLTAIWTPKTFGPRDKELWKALLAEMERASQDAFKKSWKAIPSNNRGIRDGVEKGDMDGFGEGTFFATLSTLVEPGVFDRNGNQIVDKDEIYPGVFARATVNVYAYNNMSKGVAIGLRNLQKVKDGPRLDGRGDGAKDFADNELDESWLEEHTDSLLGDTELDF